MLGLGFALTNFGTKGGVVDTPDLSGSSAAALLAAYGGEGFSMIFDSAAPSLKITDSTTPSNDWDSDLGDGYSVQDFFKTRSFTSYTGPVSTGKRLMQADGYIKPCRHNLIPMSNRFGSAAWTLTAATSTYGQTDVDGGATASLITESNTSTSVLYNATAFTTAANVPYTISCKIKKGNSTWVRLAFGTSGGTFTNGVQQWYNLDTVATGTAATTGTASYISSSITATTNSYYILTLTASQASTTGAFIVSTATADASATRTTSGTYYIYQAICNAGSQRLEYVSSEAHNLVIQSRTLGTSWTATDITVGNDATTSPDGTTSAESLTEGVAGTALLRSTAFTVPASSTVTASFYFKTSTATWVRLTLADGSDTNGVRQWFNLATGAKGTLTAIGSGTATSSAITACANGWYRCEITGVCSTSTSLTMSLSSASADASNTRVNSVVYYADCAQAELATSAGKVTTTTTTSVFNPHFDLPVEYNTDGTVKALTREEARTNIITHSDFSSFWLTQLLTKTNGQTDAGGTSIGALLECTANEVASVFQNFTVSAATAYTVSYYAKMVSGTGYARCLMYNATDGQVDGSDIAINATTWTRVTATFTPTVTSTNFYLSNGSDAAARDFYICFPQIEAGSTASSVIITGSAAVTRAADVISMSSKIFPDHVTNGTIYMSVKERNANASYGHYFGLGFDANNRVQIDDNADGAFIRAYTRKSSTNSSVLTPAVNSPGTANKISLGYDGSAVIAGYNGSSTSGSDGATSFSALNTLYIGASYDGTLPITAEIYQFMYVPTALTAGEHQTLTTA